jgi:hypothetical protein
MGVGCPEYILIFRKLPTDHATAYADEPVVKDKAEYSCGRWQLDAHAHWRSSGDRLATREEMLQMQIGQLQKAYHELSANTVYDYHAHVELAEALDAMDPSHLPKTFMAIAPAAIRTDIWDDINRMRTLNTSQSQQGRQMHVCPLQLDIVERIITRYSNKGDLVYDPFGGLGSVPYMAIRLGRRGMMCELNTEYFHDAVRYLRQAEAECSAPTLFDFADAD